MNRYNIFNQVHKDLKGMLYETVLVLQQTHFTSEEEARTTIEELAEVLLLFVKDEHCRRNFLLPAVKQPELPVFTVFEKTQEDRKLAHA